MRACAQGVIAKTHRFWRALARHIVIWETFGQNGRGGSYDKSESEDEFLHRVLLRVWPVDVRFGRGWPRVPFEHQVGGTKEQVCPIALGYRVGALRD